MYAPEWSRDEDAILNAHYEEHGPNWVGWEALLPGRSEESIRRRMVAKVERKVLRLMEKGHTPSEIDRLMGWPPGRATLVLIGRWDAGDWIGW